MKKLTMFLIVVLLSFVAFTTETKAVSDYYSDIGNPVPSLGSLSNPIPGSPINVKYGDEVTKNFRGIKLGKNTGQVGGAGANVFAAKAGTVVSVGYKEPELIGHRIRDGVTSPWYDGYEASGRGNYVIINHGSYDEGWVVTTGYYHLWDVFVSEGQSVSSSTLIGTVGSTGDTVENYLYFELMSGGNKVNPELFINFGDPVNTPIVPYNDEEVDRFVGRDSWRQEKETISLATDAINKTLEVSLNDGSDFYRPSRIEKRIEYNNKVREDNNSAPQISLYDRFGGNLQFIPYYGEKKFNLSIIDTLYEKMKYNDGIPSFSLGDFFTKRTGMLENEVYTNRPEIISEEERSAGGKDPRVEQYSALNTTGGSASLGNMYLGFGNFITKTILWLSGNGIFLILSEAWDTVVTSGAWSIFADQIIKFMPLISIFFIVYLLKQIYKHTLKNISTKEVLINIANYVLSLTIIFYIVLSPDAFTNINTYFISVIDSVFSSALNASGDEVSQSSDLELVTEAAIWKQAVLDPWCKGMFDGREYSELYTQYEENSDLSKLPQSSDDIFSDWATEEHRYNSKYHTGDIKIPIGNGKYVRNWAALAWSVQSDYHINAVEDTTSDINIGVWPYAEVTPRNQSLYVDNFRWVDAKLNISPEYTSPISWNNDYNDARAYSENFVLRGMESTMLSLLLLPLLFPIIKRLISLVQIVVIVARWMIRSIRSIVSIGDNTYSPLKNIKAIFKPLYHYFWWSMIVFVIMSIYLVMTDTFLGGVVYLLLSIVIISIAKPVDDYRVIRDAGRKIKEGYRNSKKYISNKVKNFKD